jgi:hypothetical protein
MGMEETIQTYHISYEIQRLSSISGKLNETSRIAMFQIKLFRCCKAVSINTYNLF